MPSKANTVNMYVLRTDPYVGEATIANSPEIAGQDDHGKCKTETEAAHESGATMKTPCEGH
jgi:hypothetical protein